MHVNQSAFYMFIFLFMTDLFMSDLFITNTKDGPCISSPPVYKPPPPVYKAHQKSLTKVYKPRAYSRRFTVTLFPLDLAL